MRSAAGAGIGFLSPAAGTSCQTSAGPSGRESGHCGLDPDTGCQGSLVGGPSLKGSLAPAVASAGPPHSAQRSMRGAPARFAAHSRDDGSLPGRLTGPCRPGDGGCWQECLPSGSSRSLGPVIHAAWSEGSRAPKTEKRPPSPGLNGPSDTPGLPGSQDPFASSFSFIRLSLGASGQRGQAEGCLPPREAELLHQSPQGMAAEAPDSGPHEDPRPLRTFSLQATPASADSAEGTGSPSEPECRLVSSRDTGLSSQDASGADAPGGCAWAARGWHALLRDWEPVLQGCLRSHRRQLEVTSLSLKLQKLQEKAIEGGDYDEAETLRQRLEDLEQEKGRLPWALPSQQPALCSFLSYLAAQTRAALHGATKRSCSSDPAALPEGEPRTAAQDSLPASVTRRDWLLGQKEQLQREMEGLQASMYVLQAKEQQLSRELAEQESLLRWHSRDRDVTPLLARLSPSQLQEVSQALGETLASAGQAPPFPVEPLEALRSLRERTKSLSLAAREITAQVCSAERLCSSVRRRLGDLDTRLPALLEAKTLAVSGSHFCTAKELTEEVRALSAEREGLELLLGRLLALSSRSVRRLRSVQEDFVRSQQDLVLREAAHKATVEANTARRMEALEGRLRSCRCPLLGRVWSADLEACQLLMQSLRLQEADGEMQADSVGEASLAVHPRPHPGEEDTPSKVLQEWSARPAPSAHHAVGQQREESHIITAEVGEKCEAIGVRLLHLEDQLHRASHSHDEALFQSLQGQLQMVKETLQAMMLQLQPTKEAGGEAAPSQRTAGAQGAEA